LQTEILDASVIDLRENTDYGSADEDADGTNDAGKHLGFIYHLFYLYNVNIVFVFFAYYS